MPNERDESIELRGLAPVGQLSLRHGHRKDYEPLARFHYLSRRPATAVRTLVVELETPATFWRGPQCRIVAILVESMPPLNCAARNHALNHRYRRMSKRDAAIQLNRDIRTISRVIVHPQWRGLALGVRLVQHALATATTRYTEAIAAMGRIHPLFAHAGMKAFDRPPRPRDQRLIASLADVGLEAWMLVSITRIHEAINADPRAGPIIEAALQTWAGCRHTPDEALLLARRKLLLNPRYYLKINKLPSLRDPS